MEDGATEPCLKKFPCRSTGPFMLVTQRRAHMRAGPEKPYQLKPSGIAQRTARQKDPNANIRGEQKSQITDWGTLISSNGIPRRSALFLKRRARSVSLIS